jgi:hypothetical protein
VLGVQGEQWSYLVEVASEAADKGWWASYGDAMGARQAVYADLESGARLIREYQPFIPGLLQTADFARQRNAAELGRAYEPDSVIERASVEARQTRQRMMMRAGGPSYEVVIDEVAIRRPLAPPEILAAQLRHLLQFRDHPRITVRLLPVDARLRDYRVVRSAFSLYTYPGPQDPEVVAVDTVTADMVMTTLLEADQVHRYTDLYDRLVEAALSPDESADMLSAAAVQLMEGAGR